MGVANLETDNHTLNQLIQTTEKGYENYSQESKNLTGNAKLPITITPNKYWEYNLSCNPCDTMIISLKVDEEWFEFTPHQLLNGTGVIIGETHWPQQWSKVSHYTESKITPVHFSVIITSMGLVTIITTTQRSRKRELIQKESNKKNN